MSKVDVRPIHAVADRADYLECGVGKDKQQHLAEGTDRLAVMFCSTGSIDAFVERGEALSEQHGRTVQAQGYLQSFHPDEFDVNSPEDLQRVNDLGFMLAHEMHPNSDVLVVTHDDSEGHNAHNHIVVLNHDNETGRALTRYRTFGSVKKINDQLMREQGCEVLSERVQERSKELELAGQLRSSVRTSQADYWDAKRANPSSKYFTDAELDAKTTFSVRLGDAVSSAMLDPEVNSREELAEALSNVRVEGAPDEKRDGVQMTVDEKHGGVTFRMWNADTGRLNRRSASKLSSQFTIKGQEQFFAAKAVELQRMRKLDTGPEQTTPTTPPLSDLQLEAQSRLEEAKERQAAELEAMKARFAAEHARTAGEAKQRREALDAERAEDAQKRQEVLDNSPAKFSDLAVDELAQVVDEKVIVREEHLSGDRFMRSDDLGAMQRQHELSRDEANFLATTWWSLDRPTTAQEEGRDATSQEAAQEPVQEEAADELAAADKPSATEETKSSWQQALDRAEAANVGIDSSFLDAYRREQKVSEAAQPVTVHEPAPDLTQQPDEARAQQEDTTNAELQHSEDEQAEAVTHDGVVAEVEPADPPYRSRLRDARSKAPAMQARLAGLAEVEEQWHSAPPSTPQERIEFERQITSIGVGRKVLDRAEPHMDPQLHERLTQRAEQSEQASRALERKKELDEKVARLEEDARADRLNLRGTADRLRDTRHDLRFEVDYIDRVRQDREAGVYTPREHERAEHIEKKASARAAEVEPTEAEKRLQESKEQLQQDRKDQAADNSRDRGQGMEQG